MGRRLSEQEEEELYKTVIELYLIVEVAP